MLREVLTQHCNLQIMEVDVFETTFILNFLTYVRVCQKLLQAVSMCVTPQLYLAGAQQLFAESL